MDALLKRNVSTLFLLSPIGINFEEYRNLIDAYIDDVQKEYGNYYVLVLMKYDKNDPKSYATLTENKYFVEDYDYEGYIVYVYVFPEEFQEDYDHVVKGEYSKVSKEFKETFPKKVLYTDANGKSFYKNSFAHKLINRFDYLLEDLTRFFGTEITTDMEYWKLFDKEKETLNISKLKEKENEKHNATVFG